MQYSDKVPYSHEIIFMRHDLGDQISSNPFRFLSFSRPLEFVHLDEAGFPVVDRGQYALFLASTRNPGVSAGAYLVKQISKKSLGIMIASL